ncbi:MAG: hypothetical protein JXB34_02015 [Bacteroidales bacterium]|nr:hypothetical protein [Bacteroidales bacterium]
MKQYLFCIIAALILFPGCNDDDENNNNGQNSSNVVTVNYNIEQARVWSKDTVYLLPNGIKVMAALTIQAGTVIKIGAGKKIEVWEDGVINAIGTSADTIVFTSVKDDSKGGDTNKDQQATSPDKGDWGCIDMGYSNGSSFAYCQFSYGGNTNNYGTLHLGTGTHSVTNSLFTNNGAYVSSDFFCGALFADNANSSTVIKHNVFFNNIVPLTIDSHISLDNSNTFHNPANSSVTNKYNGIFIHTQDIMENHVSWAETEVAFVVTYGSLEIWENFSLTLANDVVLKFTGGAGLVLHNLNTLINYNSAGVKFTSFKDDSLKGDTNGDGTASSPTDGDWDGIFNNAVWDYVNWANIYYSEN